MIEGWDNLCKKFVDIKILNLQDRVSGLENMFVEYAECNPKGDDQWTEARLRALEDKMSLVYEGKVSNHWKSSTIMESILPDTEHLQDMHQKTMLAILQDRIESNLQFTGKMCLRLDQIEKWFNEAKQTHDTDLKRVGSDFERIFKRIEALEARQNPNSYNKDAI